MLALATGRWVLRRALGDPIAWLIGLLAFLATPLMLELSPWVPHQDHLVAQERIARSWIAPLGYLGVSFGLSILASGEAFLLRFGATDRFWGLFWGLGAPAVALHLCLLGSNAAGLDPETLAKLGIDVIAIDLFLISIALCVWSLGGSPRWRFGVFLGMVWLLPALLADGGFLERLSAPWKGPPLAAGSMLSFASESSSAVSWLIGQSALLGAAWLLLVPSKALRA